MYNHQLGTKVYPTHPQSDQIRVRDMNSCRAIGFQFFFDRLGNPESERVVSSWSRNRPTGDANDAHKSSVGLREAADGAVARVVSGENDNLSPTLVCNVGDQAPQGEGDAIYLEERGAVEHDALLLVGHVVRGAAGVCGVLVWVGAFCRKVLLAAICSWRSCVRVMCE